MAIMKRLPNCNVHDQIEITHAYLSLARMQARRFHEFFNGYSDLAKYRKCMIRASMLRVRLLKLHALGLS